MDRGSTVRLPIFIFFILLSHSIANDQHHEKKMEEVQANKMSYSEAAKSLFSPPTNLPSKVSTTSQWMKVKTLINQAQSYCFPLNLDFTGSEEAETGRVGGGGATGEKVKEAVVKSLERSRSTVEDTAKSAAKLARETTHKTAQKAKETLSHSDSTGPDHGTEL